MGYQSDTKSQPKQHILSALVAWPLLEGYCPESICPLQLKRDYITHLSTP